PLTHGLDGTVSPRDALHRLQRQPSDCRYVSVQQFGQEWEGSSTQYQFSAMSYEALVFLLHTLKQVCSEKAIKPVPEPLELPGREAKKKTSPWEQMLRLAREHSEKG